ncbi:MAG: nitrile hydratase accessory protein [Marinovum sp.]|nr:nitrile hydratase accessory protein [Marinovum sp.]
MIQPDAAPFEEPWQAQLFALTVALNESGAFTWSEWAAFFGPRVQKVEASAYWQVWSEALVAMLEARGIADAEVVFDLQTRWQDAARATPHGMPIELL